MSHEEHQIEAWFCLVTCMSDDGRRWTLRVCNAVNDSYTIKDIYDQVQEWLESQKVEAYVVGVEEQEGPGFCIVAM